MMTSGQAIRACVMADFLTTKGLPVRVFKYIETDRLIRIEAGFRSKEIKLVINEKGLCKYV